MIIDIRKLSRDKQIPLNDEVKFNQEYYQNLDIIDISPVKAIGALELNYDDEMILKCNMKGVFTIPCSVSLEPVEEPFEVNIEQIIGENDLKSQINLDLSSILWENVVLEVPIKVIKKDIEVTFKKGDGWELEGY